MRYKITLEYDGSPFVGWQRQDNGDSVQAAVEKAIYSFCGETTIVHSAGRTDAGVHALAMVAHFDLDKEHAPDVVTKAINFHLKPAPISALATGVADVNFHARFSCAERRYTYRIINRRAPLTIDRNRAWRIGQRLDVNAMNEAAQSFVGRHDFSTFRAAACQAKSPIKTLRSITVTGSDDKITLSCAARSFLHHQVRSMTGTLVEVGRGKRAAKDIVSAISAKDRAFAGPTAPACGLYFERAIYENN